MTTRAAEDMDDNTGQATTDALQQRLDQLAAELEVPGVAVGLLLDGVESYAFHGVTSVENPLDVDADTLFQFGSTGKTYTATAMLRLVEQGKVDLDATVRTYLPDFTLRDDEVARRITVAQLFNHTAGWEGDMEDDTGEGDDALERYVDRMEKLQQVTPLGATVSYNNAALSVAGLIIARTCGTTYEQAIRDLVLTPLGLEHTYFFPNEIMSRRFVVGHAKHPDGRITVSRPWAMHRGNAPAGGMSSTVGDQIAWAKFHLGDGKAPDGTELLSSSMLHRMQEQTVAMPGSAIGDAVGISWLLRDVDGVRLVGHGGTTIGQYSEFVMVPERQFAFTSLTNCGPNGAELNHTLLRWALQHYLDVVDADPEPISLADEALGQYTGQYETILSTYDITAANGRLSVEITIKPEAIQAMLDSGEEVPEDLPTVPLAMLAADGDRYIVPEGPGKGMRGYFSRGPQGQVDGVHLGGRLATRVAVTV